MRPSERRTADVAEERLRGLLAAHQAVVGDLDLRSLLHTVVSTARRLVDAEYAALGVLAPDGGGLDLFVQEGMDEATAIRIGRCPEGEGLLGALIRDPRPIRLEHLTRDPRAVGFPAQHPVMDSFLGVPVRVQGEVFGNLYLTDATGGAFGADDEAMVEALAATAGIAIQNARVFAQSQQRQAWLEASAEVTRQVLLAGEREALQAVADSVQRLADADLVTLLLPDADEALVVAAAAGPGASGVPRGTRHPLAGTLSAGVLSSGEPSVVEGSAPTTAGRRDLPDLELGPAMVLPMKGSHGVRGVVVVVRRRGRRRFTGGDCDTALSFATHAALALELAEARRDQQRMVVLEDRARIARDLHDHVIQQLFAAGMAVDGVAASLDGPVADRLELAADMLNDAARQIRTSIFHLQPHPGGQEGLRRAVLRVAGEAGATVTGTPQVTFAGPVDLVTDPALTEDVVAVVREGLSNIAKHAHARQARVAVAATATHLTVTITDDGRGVALGSRRSGLANLRDRARARGGDLRLDVGPGGRGTALRWSAALR